MSAGAFVNTRYQASYSATQIHPIRVQPETLTASAAAPGGAVTNAAPADPTTSPISASVSRSKRSLGLVARSITLRSTAPAPEGYLVGSTVRLPAVTQAFYDACTKDTVVTYLASAWSVVGKSQESVK